MRTVTFSDARVAALVNAKFVAAWRNRSPNFHNLDYETEQEVHQRCGEAFPTRNICTFVLSPDGTVFAYMAGYLAPALFLDFLEAAIEMRQRGFNPAMNLRPGGLDAIKAVHARWGRLKPDRVAVPPYRGQEHHHSRHCDAAREEATPTSAVSATIGRRCTRCPRSKPFGGTTSSATASRRTCATG